MRSGHVVADPAGHLVSVDAGFSALVLIDIPELIGRNVLDLTAPADRAECGERIARLLVTRSPFEVAKRFIRGDGSLIWVRNSVSLVGGGREGDQLVGTIVRLEGGAERPPAVLLDSARMLADLQQDRIALFDPSLLSSTGWSAVLAAYIAEAEGRAITVPALARRLAISTAQADRWIAALTRAGMMEIETRETDPYAPKSFRLTAGALARLERHLARASDRAHGIAPQPAANGG